MKLPESLTLHINRMGHGDQDERKRVLEQVYPELLEIAKRVDWGSSKAGQTQAMEMVSEAIVRIGRLRRDWSDRDHFYATFAQAVRSARIDALRRHDRHARGDLPEELGTISSPEGLARYDVLDLEEALKQLAKEEPTANQVVTMRFYLGMTTERIAADLGIPHIKCRRLWGLSKNRLAKLLESHDNQA